MKSMPERYKEEIGESYWDETTDTYDWRYVDWLYEELLSKYHNRIEELESVLKYATLGSCHCLCKSKDPDDHSDWCLYKKIKEVL